MHPPCDSRETPSRLDIFLCLESLMGSVILYMYYYVVILAALISVIE